ncbi:hypothetical protein [Azotobacter beijerinckii]|uniref:Lipoprotein n=1 Tax=Azotobacter beijerinckii TaxID=170623 RepID=A0A1I4C245_9GAMM|nr:hypothetical protein [Azotobacter beijerinckii]SFB29248.1 hypothetical protein SAMN04244571_02108 [Azotobacter beijerinckii]SFK74419.1 hypothetical protein SAMN04244574_01710 [Azotobacter beijerinckii]
MRKSKTLAVLGLLSTLGLAAPVMAEPASDMMRESARRHQEQMREKSLERREATREHRRELSHEGQKRGDEVRREGQTWRAAAYHGAQKRGDEVRREGWERSGEVHDEHRENSKAGGKHQ